MKKLFVFVFLAFCFSAPAQGAMWYVDKAAAGAATGQTWADAWQDFSQIVWANIAPGDTVYISQGEYESGTISPSKGGTPGKPITIKTSQEPGHNGRVTIKGRFSFGENWITIDGAKDDTFAQRVMTNTVNVTRVAENINLYIVGDNAINFYGLGPQGVRVLWADITTASDEKEVYGVRINPAEGSDMFATEIAYCRIHDTGQDAIYYPQGSATPDWDDLVVHHCLIEGTGDDGIEANAGLTVHHSILRDTRHVRGHPDGIQGLGNYNRIYNNIFYDWWSASIRMQGVTKEGGVYGPNHIYGNLFFSQDHANVTTVVEYVWYGNLPPSWAVQNSFWREMVFVNNTVAKSGNGAFTIAKRDNTCTNAFLQNFLMQNNIFYSTTNWAISLKGYESGGWFYDENEFVFEDNIVSGDTGSQSSAPIVPSLLAGQQNVGVNFLGVTFETVEALNTGTKFERNTSASPAFKQADKLDFRLKEADTTARNRAANLEGLDLPGLERDLYGNLRGWDGNWDRGAIEYVDAFAADAQLPAYLNSIGIEPPAPDNITRGLMVHIAFENDFSQGMFEDKSGNNRHALRLGRPTNPTNWPTRITASSIPGRPTPGGSAAHFKWYVDGWGQYGKSGDYAAITNISGLTDLPEATIMLWGRYNPHYPQFPDFSVDGNATFLSAGHTKPGAWQLGRYGNAYTVFQVMTNTVTFKRDLTVGFPDGAWGNGDTTNWNHYAVTFDKGLAKSYFNGQLISTSTIQVPSLTIGREWIALGCWTHNGTAPMEPGEGFPNNGWLNGSMDDIRIYNRPLSQSEIQSIVAGQIVVGTAPQPPANLRVLIQ